ncbi:cytochrome c oxidase assembly protein CtaG/Cox11-domain-containing protein [Stachybotrys elegans]|uniref:Cytochrome c oxidase assembly protein CtaG/Cox11-domain-containing protein n=1 Tax=Stachybotrys elegans TaxID=80388 RepID=A0A8K0STM2_9HYPO|nr:cytochrome c oxidase assembly protein CtaG/Cox11-domain-containing protein [Stachybotrys elegans]
MYYRKKVAIVGGGSAGIAALWALNRTYHDVYLYEAADRLGGHANTVQWKKGKFTTAVDVGFTWMNETTFPNFAKFLDRLGVAMESTEMSFTVSRDGGAFEWARSDGRRGFRQWRSYLSPRIWRIVFDTVRFNHFALDVIMGGHNESVRQGVTNGCETKMETIGEFLQREGYSDAFRDDYLIPLVSALWSASPDKCSLDIPAATLIQFLWKQNLLSSSFTRQRWATLKEGSQAYVSAVMKGFPPNHLFLKTAVRRISNDAQGRVVLHLENGKSEVYDHVILATHGDEAMSIVDATATLQERAILSSFQTTQTEVVLHCDTSLMPKSRKAWSSWNYLSTSSPLISKTKIDQACLTYNLNKLQNIPRAPFGDVLLTLNPLHRPRPELTQGRYFYSNPLYTTAAIHAQKELRDIQNRRGISYAGAWTRYGFHEDGFTSGLFVAKEYLGAKLPFEFTDSTYNQGKRPTLGLGDHLLRLLILFIQVFVRGPLSSRLFGFRGGTSRPVPMGLLLLLQLPPAARAPSPSAEDPIDVRLDASHAAAASAAATAPNPPSIYGRGGARANQGEEPDAAVCAHAVTRRYYALSVSIGAVALAYSAVPLYKMVCQTIGWGGQPVRAHQPGDDGSDISSRVVPVKDAQRIRVTFNSSVSDTLPWKFVPQQREVSVLPGETALAFYKATNQGDKDIIGVATYSVTPAQCAPYFSKIQCFCFEEQRLNAGETVDMPVFFYLDPDLLNDINMRGVQTVTLNYTFFKARYDNNGRFQRPMAA